jgi:glycosyltransferase involved in cell wall biosynthesis
MSRMTLRPYTSGDSPAHGSVPVSAIVLALNEEPNIGRCLSSLSWADQLVVVDSGSCDNTVPIAAALGAEIVHQPWLGYSGQREFALGLPQLRHNWVYFLDADEWVSPELAAEISAQLFAPAPALAPAAFAQRFRLIFQGTWIRHCGWYRSSSIVRLVDRRYTTFNGEPVGERACIDGLVGQLRNDIVDEDLKGLAAWLRKHVGYAQLHAERRGTARSLPDRLRRIRERHAADTRPLLRQFLRDVVFPSLPARPVLLFCYQYILKFGVLDGSAGLRFCFYRAWYEATIIALQKDSERHRLSSAPELRRDEVFQ